MVIEHLIIGILGFLVTILFLTGYLQHRMTVYVRDYIRTLDMQYSNLDTVWAQNRAHIAGSMADQDKRIRALEKRVKELER